MKLTLQVDASAATIELRNVQAKAGDLHKFFTDFSAYMQSVTLRTFQRLGKGGDFRGVHWNGFASQYTRKTDGVTVPAKGGVKRLRKGFSARTRKSGRIFYSGVSQNIATGQFEGKQATGGTVRGRLRNSGKRVTASSKLMQDTGQLRAAALNNVKIRDSLLVMDTRTKYAGYQNQLRPFAFFNLPTDANVAQDMLLRRLK